jgi:hypothetical protein
MMASAEDKVRSGQDLFDELCFYTLAHGDFSFIHQHVVDAFAAQTAGPNDKPIKLTFALVGLYLHVEKQFTGRQVQQAHMKLGRRKQAWPVFELPEDRGEITVDEVLAREPGPDRDKAIHDWCVSVWNVFRNQRSVVVELLRENEILSR